MLKRSNCLEDLGLFGDKMGPALWEKEKEAPVEDHSHETGTDSRDQRWHLWEVRRHTEESTGPFLEPNSLGTLYGVEAMNLKQSPGSSAGAHMCFLCSP